MEKAVIVGVPVRSYDFPGMSETEYVEGIVTRIEGNLAVIHITKDVSEGVEHDYRLDGECKARIGKYKTFGGKEVVGVIPL